MFPPVIGLAWPEEHPHLRFMAEVLQISLRVQELRNAAAPGVVGAAHEEGADPTERMPRGPSPALAGQERSYRRAAVA